MRLGSFVLVVCVIVGIIAVAGVVADEAKEEKKADTTVETKSEATTPAPVLTVPDPDAPIVFAPMKGDLVGPATMVRGKAKPGSLVVIKSEVFDIVDNNPHPRMVPGHRHYVNPDGTFALLVATPRIFIGLQLLVRYEIHVYTLKKDGTESKHVVIPVTQTAPTPP
jgi:hypothetical protein